MFKKPFKTKSNCQLKSSEKKKLLMRIKAGLPHLVDDHELFLNKDAMNVVKVTTYSGANVNIFVQGPTPVFFEFQDTIFPTIFTLWKFPDLVFAFSTYDAVVEKLYNGADLMLPGVLLPEGISSALSLITKGSPVGVCTVNNLACIAVGELMTDGKQIAQGTRFGRAVKVLHIYGDELCKVFTDMPKRPHIDPVALSATLMTKNEGNGNFEEQSTEMLESCPTEEKGEDVNEVKSNTSPHELDDVGSPSETEHLAKEIEENMVLTPSMDELAQYCLFKALTSNKLELPILANLFYKNFMLSSVPKGLELNIKKTQHKKLSSMLKSLVNEGAMEIEDNKGVQTILSVKYSHPIFKGISHTFEAFEDMNTESKPEPANDGISALEIPVEIREDLVINKLVSPLFEKTEHKKGDSVSVEVARELIVAYVKRNELTQASSQMVTLDPILAQILNTRQLSFPWNELMSRILEKMGKCYLIRTSKDRLLTGKGKIPMIELSTATRTGNKSVTLVDNLERYGISIKEFARHCQHALAASTTTNQTATGIQFQVQGSHKPYICSLLVEKYNIPKKLILGYAEKTKGKKNRK